MFKFFDKGKQPQQTCMVNRNSRTAATVASFKVIIRSLCQQYAAPSSTAYDDTSNETVFNAHEVCVHNDSWYTFVCKLSVYLFCLSFLFLFFILAFLVILLLFHSTCALSDLIIRREIKFKHVFQSSSPFKHWFRCNSEIKNEKVELRHAQQSGDNFFAFSVRTNWSLRLLRSFSTFCLRKIVCLLETVNNCFGTDCTKTIDILWEHATTGCFLRLRICKFHLNLCVSVRDLLDRESFFDCGLCVILFFSHRPETTTLLFQWLFFEIKPRN